MNLIQVKWAHGRRIASAVRWSLTDDRGDYRFDGLDPGSYYILANWQLGRFGIRTVVSGLGQPEMAMVSTYYPHSESAAAASPIPVTAAREASGIDVRLQFAKTFHVMGILKDAGAIDVFTNKAPVPSAARNDGVQKDYAEFGGWFRQDGSFDIAGVPACEYLVREARRTEILSSTARVRVEAADAGGVVISPNRFSVEIKARFEDEPTHDLSKWAAGLTPVDSNGVRLMTWNHSNVIENVAPGWYLFEVYPNEAAYVKQVRVGGKEVRTSEIELKGGEQVEFLLARGVRDVEGEFDWPEPRPVNPRRDSCARFSLCPAIGAVIRSAQVDQNGGFEFSGVPPGRYRAFVVTGFNEDLWENREFYRLLEQKGLLLSLSQVMRAVPRSTSSPRSYPTPRFGRLSRGLDTDATSARVHRSFARRTCTVHNRRPSD